MHVSHFLCATRKQFGFSPFERLFDGLYFSHILGVRKPAVDAFRRVIHFSHVKPEQTLFIDDLARNVEGARAAGLLGYQLLPDETVENLMGR